MSSSATGTTTPKRRPAENELFKTSPIVDPVPGRRGKIRVDAPLQLGHEPAQIRPRTLAVTTTRRLPFFPIDLVGTVNFRESGPLPARVRSWRSPAEPVCTSGYLVVIGMTRVRDGQISKPGPGSAEGPPAVAQ